MTKEEFKKIKKLEEQIDDYEVAFDNLQRSRIFKDSSRVYNFAVAWVEKNSSTREVFIFLKDEKLKIEFTKLLKSRLEELKKEFAEL